MTSNIAGNPNYASSHIGMNDNIMWPNQMNSIHTANSHHMGMHNNGLGNFHGNVRCSYPVSSTTRSENFLDSMFSNEQTSKNFTQESDQGQSKSIDNSTGIIQNTVVKDPVDITSTSSAMEQSMIPKKFGDEMSQSQNPSSNCVAEQSSTSTPTPTANVITTTDNDIVHMDRESNWIDLLTDDLHLEESSILDNETEKNSAESLDNMMESKSKNTESKDVQNVVSPKVTENRRGE